MLMADTFQRKPLVFCSFSVLSKDIFSPPLHQSVYLVVVLPSSDLRISEAAFFQQLPWQSMDNLGFATDSRLKNYRQSIYIPFA